MARPVAYAKTTRPSFAGVLARERLYGALDRKRRSPLLWVCGPPGSGKTTLVASYLESRGANSQWYQLDSTDADPGTLFHYMAQAATAAGIDTCSVPRYSSEHHADPEGFARRYFRALFGSLPQPFLLVLDNYHEVPSHSDFHRVLQVGLAELPPECCICIVSRSEPPAAMARLRANRQIEMLGWEELRLSRDESDAIVGRWGAPCSNFHLEQLYEKTRGWAAGLILMLDQVSTSLGADLFDLSAPQVVFDYLAGEIFDNFDLATRQLLLSTAFVPEMTGTMAAELCGETRVAELLAELHHNYHLVGRSPGPDEPVYRYHPLLSEFLVAKANASMSTADVRALLRRSAATLERHGAVEDAVKLALRAGDWGEAARLVCGHAAEILHQGRAETLDGWLEAMPPIPRSRLTRGCVIGERPAVFTPLPARRGCCTNRPLTVSPAPLLPMCRAWVWPAQALWIPSFSNSTTFHCLIGGLMRRPESWLSTARRWCLRCVRDWSLACICRWYLGVRITRTSQD